MKALEEMKDPRAVKPLIQALLAKDRSVRLAVVQVLGALKDPRTVTPLIQALGDQDWVVGDAAAQALGDLTVPDVAEPLLRALDPKGRFTHTQIMILIALCRSPSAIKPDDRFTTLLVRSLQDRHAAAYAAWLLGKLGDKTAVEPLISALNSTAFMKESDADTKQAIIAALVTLGDPSAIDPLCAEMSKGSRIVRALAAEAAFVLGDRRHISETVNALTSLRELDTPKWWWRAKTGCGTRISYRFRNVVLNNIKNSDDEEAKATLRQHREAENRQLADKARQLADKARQLADKARQLADKARRRQEALESAEQKGTPVGVDCQCPNKRYAVNPSYPQLKPCLHLCYVSSHTITPGQILVTTEETSEMIAWYCEKCNHIYCRNCTMHIQGMFRYCPECIGKVLRPASIGDLRTAHAEIHCPE